MQSVQSGLTAWRKTDIFFFTIAMGSNLTCHILMVIFWMPNKTIHYLKISFRCFLVLWPKRSAFRLRFLLEYSEVVVFRSFTEYIATCDKTTLLPIFAINFPKLWKQLFFNFDGRFRILLRCRVVGLHGLNRKCQFSSYTVILVII